MSVRSDRYGLVFKLEADGSTTEQELPAPVAPMKPSEYLTFLAANVKDRDGSIDQLNGRLIAEEGDEEAEDGRPDEDYELPPGATFAAHGDTEETQAERREESAKFKELGSNSDSDFILHHAPKPMRAIRFVPVRPDRKPVRHRRGRSGPARGRQRLPLCARPAHRPGVRNHHELCRRCGGVPVHGRREPHVRRRRPRRADAGLPGAQELEPRPAPHQRMEDAGGRRRRERKAERPGDLRPDHAARTVRPGRHRPHGATR